MMSLFLALAFVAAFTQSQVAAWTICTDTEAGCRFVMEGFIAVILVWIFFLVLRLWIRSLA